MVFQQACIGLEASATQSPSGTVTCRGTTLLLTLIKPDASRFAELVARSCGRRMVRAWAGRSRIRWARPTRGLLVDGRLRGWAEATRETAWAGRLRARPCLQPTAHSDTGVMRLLLAFARSITQNIALMTSKSCLNGTTMPALQRLHAQSSIA